MVNSDERNWIHHVKAMLCHDQRPQRHHGLMVSSRSKGHGVFKGRGDVKGHGDVKGRGDVKGHGNVKGHQQS